MSSNKNDPKKVFDVAKPGDSEPGDTARPVIVGHKILTKDPMVSDTGGEKGDSLLENSEATKPVKKSGVTISPPSQKTVEPTKADSTTAPTDVPAEDVKEALAEPAATEDPKEKGNEAEPETPESSESGEVAAAAEQAGAKKEAKKVSQAEQAQSEQIQKLIKSKQYNVDIKQGLRTKSGSRAGLVLVLVLILAAAGAYLAIDANLINVGIDVPYHLLGE